MKVLVQRCNHAKVTVDNKVVGSIGNGLLLLVGFTEGDTSKTIDYMVDKVIGLRIFDDDKGVMNKSVKDVFGDILSVSQFTLYANCEKGRRPSYASALAGNLASPMYDEFNLKLREKGIKVETGIFGANMQVELLNNGPVTIMLEK